MVGGPDFPVLLGGSNDNNQGTKSSNSDKVRGNPDSTNSRFRSSHFLGCKECTETLLKVNDADITNLVWLTGQNYVWFPHHEVSHSFAQHEYGYKIAELVEKLSVINCAVLLSQVRFFYPDLHITHSHSLCVSLSIWLCTLFYYGKWKI